MFCQQIKINQKSFFVVRDDIGIIYFGQPNGEIEEIKTKFGEIKLVSNDLLINEVEQQLNQFFLKQITTFNFPIHLIGTPFQKEVWKALTEIEYGKTITYLELATTMGIKTKVRAIANAIARNSLFLIIPCHRVIGSDQQLHGFRWGIDLKAELLTLEQENCNATSN